MILEVIVVAGGEVDTAGAAGRSSAGATFARFAVVHLAEGNTNVAFQGERLDEARVPNPRRRTV